MANFPRMGVMPTSTPLCVAWALCQVPKRLERTSLLRCNELVDPVLAQGTVAGLGLSHCCIQKIALFVHGVCTGPALCKQWWT